LTTAPEPPSAAERLPPPEWPVASRKLSKPPMKIAKPYRIAIYASSWGLWLTGVLWVIYHYFMRVKGPFGFRTNPLEEWWLIGHGIFAVLGTFLFGWLWSVHIVTGWDMRWRRRSGGTLAGVTIFLIVSGVLIYYIGNPDWLNWTAIAHWVIGIAALAVFFIHWLSKSRPRRAGTAKA
jgi:hypothetical protein